MSKLSLKKLAKYNDFPGPVVLLIMDGVGIGKRDESDGVYLAYTPVLDELLKEPLYTQLKAHGTAVGLPTDDDMGNSEVVTTRWGQAGVSQGARLVNEAFSRARFLKGPPGRLSTSAPRAAARFISSGFSPTAMSIATSSSCMRCWSAAPGTESSACASIH